MRSAPDYGEVPSVNIWFTIVIKGVFLEDHSTTDANGPHAFSQKRKQLI
jgi:hypothetical protein